MTSLSPHVLLGDIGATNARFALLANGEFSSVSTLKVADFARFDNAVAVFLDDCARHFQITHALLAVAGPVAGSRCVLTNCSWVIDAFEIREKFGLETRVLNDFEATALALPWLTAADLCAVGAGKAVPGAPTAVLGPGTGLGVACLIPIADQPMVLASEGGHATLGGTSDREDAILQCLRKQFGHASAERALSGDGLENIYRAIATLDGIEAPKLSAAEITMRALGGACQIAQATLETFCAFLGSFAGNVALTFGARGGVYIAGGITPRIVDFIARSEFRGRFEAKGRFRSYLEDVPSNVIVHPAATFVGLKSLLKSGRRHV